MDIEKVYQEVVKDIEKYDQQQLLIVEGMKKGARELYERLTGKKQHSINSAPEKQTAPEAAPTGGATTRRRIPTR